MKIEGKKLGEKFILNFQEDYDTQGQKIGQVR